MDIDAQLDALVEELGQEVENSQPEVPDEDIVTTVATPANVTSTVMTKSPEKATEKEGKTQTNAPDPKPAKKPAFAKPLHSVIKNQVKASSGAESEDPGDAPSSLPQDDSEKASPAPAPAPPVITKRIIARVPPSESSPKAGEPEFTNSAVETALPAKKPVLVKTQGKAPSLIPAIPSKVIKTAYQLFCEELRPALVVQHPKASMPEMSRLLATAWRETSAEDKAAYAAMRADLIAASGGTAEEASGVVASRPPKKEPKKRARAQARRPSTKRERTASESEEETEGPAERPPTSRRRQAGTEQDASEDEDSDDDERERMECDWAKHPASFIIGENVKKGRYIVARAGLPLTEYGVVCSRTAKLQRMAGADAVPCHVPLSMVEEFEAFGKRFRLDVHGAQDDNELDLESLPAGSSLEMCSLLGKLREPGFELSSRGKNDIWMRLPLLATCRVLQLVVEAERRLAGADAAVRRTEE